MSNLSRCSGSNLPDGFSRAEGKALQGATNKEVARALLANARLAGAHYLTNTAMQNTVSLARTAYALADGDEYLASRLGSLVDSYVAFARAELNQFGGLA